MRRFAGIGLGLAVIVATFIFVLPRIADYRDVWDVVTQLSWPELGALVLVTIVNLATFAPPGVFTRSAEIGQQHKFLTFTGH